MVVHKAYFGDVDYDDEAETFYGKVVNAGVLVSFRGRTVAELKESFRNVVEAYLEERAEIGVEPEKPYSGTLTIRVDPAVRRRVARKAATAKVSMNRYVEDLLARATEDMAAMEGGRKGGRAAIGAKRGRGGRSAGRATKGSDRTRANAVRGGSTGT